MWIFDANKGQRVGNCVGYNDEKERIKKNTNNYVIIYLLLMIMIHFGDMKMIVLMKNYETDLKESNNDEAK